MYIIYLYVFRSIGRGQTLGTLLHVKACLQKRHCTLPIRITRRVAQNIKEHRLYYNTRHSVSAHTSEKCNLTLAVSASMPCVHNCAVQRVSADAECLPIYTRVCAVKNNRWYSFSRTNLNRGSTRIA